MNKTITFRNAILASFLIFIAIILLLALQVFFIHGEEEKLRQFGIAAPLSDTMDKKALFGQERVLECPFCASKNTEMIAQFGSTSCKALFRCLDCLEPFDYFKCH